MIYSFSLSKFEEGALTATRHPDNRAVGGDWVCAAGNDAEAIMLAQKAALDEWAAPETRDPLAFEVEFFDAPTSRSGTPWTEDQRAARGRGRMTLRMAAEAHDMLAELAEDAGCSASEHVEELVRRAHKRRP